MAEKHLMATIHYNVDGKNIFILTRGDISITHTRSGADSPVRFNDGRGLEDAYEKLLEAEANPPQVPEPPAPETPASTKRVAANKNVYYVPVEAGPSKQVLKEHLVLPGKVKGKALETLLKQVGRLIDAGLWDGKTRIEIGSTVKFAAFLTSYDNKELGTLWSLDEVLDTARVPEQGTLFDKPAADGLDVGESATAGTDDTNDSDMSADDSFPPDADEPEHQVSVTASQTGTTPRDEASCVTDGIPETRPDVDAVTEDTPDEDDCRLQNHEGVAATSQVADDVIPIQSTIGKGTCVTIIRNQNVFGDTVDLAQGIVIDIDGDEVWVEDADTGLDDWFLVDDVCVM